VVILEKHVAFVVKIAKISISLEDTWSAGNDVCMCVWWSSYDVCVMIRV
jgi:hypothetical protein